MVDGARRRNGSDEFSLLLISFLVLFFELVCIRWISSTVSYIGLFSNLILLAAFLGIGVGCILHRSRMNLMNYFPVLVFFLTHLMSSGMLASTIHSRALLTTTGGLFYVTPIGRIMVDTPLLIGAIFAFVTLMFTTLSQDLGRLLGRFEPLRAYSLNVIGSLAGIIAFSAMSHLRIGPVYWFACFYLLLLLFGWVNHKGNTFLINFFIFLPVTLVSVYLISYGFNQPDCEVRWSPYYRIEKIGDVVVVNKIGHQTIRTPPEMESVQYPPRYLTLNRTFDDVLIIGSGTGTDTAASLYFNNSRVDAVEIDPVIIELGREYSPSRPYSDPRVTVINDDARSYLMKTDKKYDLIVYGLTDSLTALSTYGSLRLESYLYTVEAFREVRAHLKDGGLFVTGNYYPNVWFADKLAVMLEEAFDQKPHVVILRGSEDGEATVGETEGILTFSGPGAEGAGGGAEYEVTSDVTPATDDWPFFYMQNPSIPGLYLHGLLVVAGFTAVLFLVLRAGGHVAGVNPHFFFLGAAFMLLETKSIINFSLLYGATWIVNSLVFASILVMVLAAVYVVDRHTIRDVRPLYVLLFSLLLLNYLVPLNVFLAQGGMVRYILSTVFLFSPIFVANVIFSSSFKHTSESSADYASNILGAVLGGVTEYLSLVTGYRNLMIAIGVFYFLAFYRRWRS